MPFIAPNIRGKTSQPEKPPWVRDTSSQQSVKDVLRADAPWRRQNNGGEVPTPVQAPPEPNSQASKPGTSKLQINLKPAVKKPEPEPPKPKESVVPIKKEITIPIQFKEDSPAPTLSLPNSSNSSNDYRPKINSSKVKYLPTSPANNDLVKPIPTNNLQKKEKERESPVRKPEPPEGRESPIRKPNLATATVIKEATKERQIPIQKADSPNAREKDSPVKKFEAPKEKTPFKVEAPKEKEAPLRKTESPKDRDSPLGKTEPNKERDSPLRKTEANKERESPLRKTEVNNRDSPLRKVEANKERNSPLRKTDASKDRDSPVPKVEAPVKERDSPGKKPEPFSKKSQQPSSAGKEKQVPIAIIAEKAQPPVSEPSPAIKHNLKPVESKIKNLNSPSPKVPASPESNIKPSSNMPGPPPPPPPPPGPPPPPPPPGLPPSGPTNPAKKKVIESLKKTPRKRPDWSDMMKQIEAAKERKLNHVECNDRSRPILPRMKSRGKFVFDSEAKPANKADAVHNLLLTQIAGGVKLKKVQCNDRSKPILTGLRKFRRQLTMEEKDKAPGTTEELPPPPGEEEIGIEGLTVGMDIDDIDTLRDELQSAKQMLELEIQAKLLLAKENRDLKCQNITMEAQIEQLRYDLQKQLSLIPYDEGRRDSRVFKDLRKSKSGLYKCPSGVRKSKSGFGPKGNANKDKKGGEKEEDEDLGELNELEEEINVLRIQIHSAKKIAEDWESKYKEANEKLLLAQGKYEDAEQRLLVLDKKIEKLQTQKGMPNITSNDKWTQTEEQIQQQGRRVSRQQSSRKASDGSVVAGGGVGPDGESGDDDDSDDSDLEVDESTVIRKKQEREIKLWENKLRNVKEKQVASKLERKSLKQQQKKLEEELKEQKSRLKELQKEVDKMAKMMKSDEGKEDGDEDEEEEEEEEEEETETEDEDDDEDTEEETSSESEEESSSEEDDPSASHDDRLNLFMNRVKRWDNILNALRKGNYLLRANIDRLRDDLEDVRIKYHDLEHELNTVLADV